MIAADPHEDPGLVCNLMPKGVLLHLNRCCVRMLPDQTLTQ